MAPLQFFWIDLSYPCLLVHLITTREQVMSSTQVCQSKAYRRWDDRPQRVGRFYTKITKRFRFCHLLFALKTQNSAYPKTREEGRNTPITYREDEERCHCRSFPYGGQLAAMEMLSREKQSEIDHNPITVGAINPIKPSVAYVLCQVLRLLFINNINTFLKSLFVTRCMCLFPGGKAFCFLFFPFSIWPLTLNKCVVELPEISS